jgi:hypothetical protein
MTVSSCSSPSNGTETYAWLIWATTLTVHEGIASDGLLYGGGSDMCNEKAIEQQASYRRRYRFALRADHFIIEQAAPQLS